MGPFLGIIFSILGMAGGIVLAGIGGVILSGLLRFLGMISGQTGEFVELGCACIGGIFGLVAGYRRGEAFFPEKEPKPVEVVRNPPKDPNETTMKPPFNIEHFDGSIRYRTESATLIAHRYFPGSHSYLFRTKNGRYFCQIDRGESVKNEDGNWPYKFEESACHIVPVELSEAVRFYRGWTPIVSFVDAFPEHEIEEA